MEEFTPKYGILEHNKELYKEIEKTESVCVTIRRGDFVENKKFKQVYDVCTKSYYYRGMKEIAKQVKDPCFVIFSDDIPWIKKHMKFPYNVYYEDGTDTVQEKLRMMYSCKHFVISNSTFSWWAQYLSRNPNKIVVSPNRWYNSRFQTALIGKDWILLDPDKE